MAHSSIRSEENWRNELEAILKICSFIKLMSNDYSVMRSWYAKNTQDFLSIEKFIHDIDEKSEPHSPEIILKIL